MQAGDGLKADNSSWRFKGEVVSQFDEHISKSVPLYKSGHELVAQISDYFIKDDGIYYDLGCSTGSLSRILSSRHKNKHNLSFIGIDCEDEMIKKAIKISENYSNCSFFKDDILGFNFEKTDFITAYYTIQFTKPSIRQLIIDKIFESLNWGGAFLMFEKVRGSDARFQDIFTGLYNEFKLENGYTAEEVLGKTRSLKGVLEPFSSQANIDLLKRAGFKDIIPIMKYICFEGVIAIK